MSTQEKQARLGGRNRPRQERRGQRSGQREDEGLWGEHVPGEVQGQRGLSRVGAGERRESGGRGSRARLGSRVGAVLGIGRHFGEVLKQLEGVQRLTQDDKD